ncbi:hypothetical protein [Burkholderia sp. Ac-20365]|uniref:hypothetical protein n=1 Tax=Burkholderia sp. Ac-20365 TaxID=2703897 RepID=UPI00197BC6F3|nr:hypothetical protein [Burkholderia sp. Ac-20365]MBN3760744.1 hypothetical protein [Burkholderia sp. Ac-20365]
MATTPRAMTRSPSPAVRQSVRALLDAKPGFHTLDAPTRRDVASALVRIADAATALSNEEQAARAAPRAQRPALSRSQDAGSSFSGVAASKVARTTTEILNAVSFPRFVTELINGVFKALNDSNQQQLHSYVELIQNVAASTDGFADANIGIAGARAWLAERFPGSFVVQADDDDALEPPEASMSPEDRAAAQAERDATTRLVLRQGASMPGEAALRTALGLGPQDPVPSGDPESIVAPARAALARRRQQMLSTMVMMGLQRLVIESGRLTAAMRFHIDTRSAAADDRGSSFDLRNDAEVSGGAKLGPWGIEAKVKNTIGYVSTQRTQTTEEMNTDLDLNSSVELIFRTDYVALDRLAGGPAQERIRVNALNPEAEGRLAYADRAARRTAQGAAEAQRGSQLAERMSSPPPTPPSPTPTPASPGPAPASPAAASPATRTPTGTSPGATNANTGGNATGPATPAASTGATTKRATGVQTTPARASGPR